MKSIVVTGAAGGIGTDLCSALVREGWVVIAIDIDSGGLERLREKLPAVVTVVGDVRDPAVLARARAEAEAAGTLSGWVNNAAIMRSSPLHKLDDAAIELQISVNLHSAVYGTREALRSFVENNVAGSIVMISSVHGRHPFEGHPLYATAKGGIEALTRQICVEYGPRGIRCNAVAPGAVRTPMTIVSGSDTAAAADEEESAALLSPMRRISEPSEISDAVIYLLSPGARGINGHVLAVDNGMAARARTPGSTSPITSSTRSRNTSSGTTPERTAL